MALTLEQCWHRVPGGTAVAAIGLAKALADVEGLTPIGVTAWHRELPPPPWQPPIATVSLPLSRAALYEAWHAVRWPPVERATGPVDVVHATSLIVPATSAPLVVTVHDLAFLDDPSRLTARGHRFMRRGLELTRRHAAVVVCSSEDTRRACIAAGLPKHLLRVVPLGTDAEPASLGAIADAKARFGLRRPYIAWVGTFEPRKNVAGLLTAFAIVAQRDRDLELVLIGPSGWGPQLSALAEGMDPEVRARVRALGFLPDAQRNAVVAGASAFCYPSTREGFGLPVLEAMVQGTPVVTSRVTSTEEVIGDAGVVIDPGQPEEIANALSRVIRDDDLADELTRAGRARAAEMTWARCAERMVDVYRGVAAGSRR